MRHAAPPDAPASPAAPPPPRPGEAAATTPAGQAAGAAVLALARAARSFTLYDASNAVVRGLIAEYEAKARAALAFGPLRLAVAPEELLLGREVVHRDAEREKSLPFRLYRDGVRGLMIQPAAPWPELLRLLEVLAVRATGLRQGEDDTVTLLRAAGLTAVSIEAVEGFVPAEELPEAGKAFGDGRGHHYAPPASWDTPLPRLPQPGPYAQRPLRPEELARLRAELGEGGEARLGLALARDLLAEAGRAGWERPDPDLAAFLAELRDALLAEGDLAGLHALMELLQTAGAAERDEIAEGLADARTLDLVLQGVPEDAPGLPAEVVPLLSLVSVEAALDGLANADTAEGRRRLLVKVVLARLPRAADAVLARLTRFDVRVVRELVRGVAARAPERAVEVARQLLGQKDPALRVEALGALEVAGGELPVRPVAALLEDPEEVVRVRAAELLGLRAGAGALPALQARLDASSGASQAEAEALGRALARVAPAPAARLFAEWIAPRARLLRGLSAEARARQAAAVAGFAVLPGAEAERALTDAAAHADGELRTQVLAALARRRKELRGPSAG